MSDQGFTTGVGATKELSLRVSVATLVRVLFEHPRDGKIMLALERRATAFPAETGLVIQVKSQPFGGAIRIYDLSKLQRSIGHFQFDSEESRAQQDFRIFIRPSSWEIVQQFCLEQLGRVADGVFETSPARELAEEFLDTLNMDLKQEQRVCNPVGTIVERDSSPTDNHAARGYPTVRLYRIFEARILDASVLHALMTNSENHNDIELGQRAAENARHGNPGWANKVLTLPFVQLHQFYLTLSPEVLNMPVTFQNHRLDETVAATMDEIMVAKYERQ